MAKILFTYELHRIFLIACFLGCFAISRLLSRKAYRSLSKESIYDLQLEFARYGRIFIIIFLLLVLEVVYLYYSFDDVFRYQIIIETIVTTLSITLGVSQAITIFVIKKSILSYEEKRRFGKSTVIGIVSLASLCILVITFRFS